jgi:hypothetical protein
VDTKTVLVERFGMHTRLTSLAFATASFLPEEPGVAPPASFSAALPGLSWRAFALLDGADTEVRSRVAATGRHS